jgi:hypothetical protein
MTVNCDVLWHDIDKRPTTSKSINWTLGLGTVRGAVPEGASLGTAGGLPCLGAGTGKLGLVVAEDSVARWLECRTTQSTALVVKQDTVDEDTTYASPPLMLRGSNISWNDDNDDNDQSLPKWPGCNIGEGT